MNVIQQTLSDPARRNLASIAPAFCAAVDWASPGLSGSEAHLLYKAGDAVGAALRFVHDLRAGSHPSTEWSSDAIVAMKKASGDLVCQAASRSLANAWGSLEADPAKIIYALRTSDETQIVLGATPTAAAALVAACLGVRDRWGQWVWYPAKGLCTVLQPALKHEAFSDEQVLVLLAWLVASMTVEWEGERTWDDLMFGTTGHNYFVTGLGSLATAAILFPQLLPCARLAGLASRFVNAHPLLLLAPDGFTRERSGYHWGTVNELQALVNLAVRNRIAVLPEVHARMAAAHSAGGWKLTTPDAGVPCNGDTGACHSPGDGSGLRAAATMASDPMGKFIAESLTPAWKPAGPGWLNLDDHGLLARYNRLSSVRPPGPGADTQLPDSGYYVMRRDWTQTSDYCLIDAGARGNIVTSHDHAAVFNLEVFSFGTPVLYDNCSGHYGENPGRQWRKQDSSSHNVATVDGLPHLESASEWRWRGHVQPTVEAWTGTDRYSYFSGAHEGYQRLASPVVCRRKVFYLRGKYWILIDRFNAEAKAEHTYRQHFQPRAGTKLLDQGCVTTVGPAGNLLIVPVPGFMGQAQLKPNPHPLEKYDNPDTLSYTRTATGNSMLATVLVPFVGARVPKVEVKVLEVEAGGSVVSPLEVTGLEIVVDDEKTVYVDQHMYWALAWRAGGYAGEDRMFHSCAP